MVSILNNLDLLFLNRYFKLLFLEALGEALYETSEKHRKFGQNLGGIFKEDIDPDKKTIGGAIRSLAGAVTALPSGLVSMGHHALKSPPNFVYEMLAFAPREVVNASVNCSLSLVKAST